MGSAHALLALALTLGSVWLRTPVPLALGAALSMGVSLRGAGVLTLPNLVTYFRLLLPVGAILITWREPLLVLPFAVLAFVLDGLDGWLARRRGQATAFGAMFDQEADAYLVLLLCVELVVACNVASWVLIAGALRYVLVLTRLLAAGPIAERRSRLGRLIFGFSYLSLVAGLVEPALASTLLLPAAVGALVFSFAPDFFAIARTHAAPS